MLEFQNINIGYLLDSEFLPVIAQLSLRVCPGDVVGLIGPSGSGKSTVLKCAAGLLVANRGQVCISDQVWYMPQAPALLPFRTALQNVLLGVEFDRRLRAADVERGRQALSAVGLQASLGRRPSQLSGGMRRRVAVVQALVSGRKLVVLDEPMAELDLGARKAIEMAIGEVANEGRACLFASHEIDSVAAVATQVVVLEGERPAKAVLHDLSVDFPPGLSALERRSHPRFTDVVARLQREAWR